MRVLSFVGDAGPLSWSTTTIIVGKTNLTALDEAQHTETRAASRAPWTSSGERWALLVVRELMLGPKRFTDLRAGLPRVGPDMLAARLRELEEAGVVRRAHAAPPAALEGLRADRVGRRARAGADRAGPLGQPSPAARPSRRR